MRRDDDALSLSLMFKVEENFPRLFQFSDTFSIFDLDLSNQMVPSQMSLSDFLKSSKGSDALSSAPCVSFIPIYKELYYEHHHR